MIKRRYIAIAVLVAGAGAGLLLIDRHGRDVSPRTDTVGAAPTARTADSIADANQEPTPTPRGSSRPAPTLATRYTPAEAYEAANGLLSCLELESESLLPPGSTDAEVAEILSNRETLRTQCNAMETSHSMYDLAKYAAEAGNVDAQVNFSLFASLHFAKQENTPDPATVQAFRRDAMRYLNRAAAGGSVEALQRLANAHEAGTYGSADPVKAYAYARAFASRHPSELSMEYLRRLERNLSSTQVRNASAHAEQILDNLDNH